MDRPAPVRAPTAALALEVSDRGAVVGSNGEATVFFEAGGCAAFTVTVTAPQAATPVGYVVAVGTSASAPG